MLGQLHHGANLRARLRFQGKLSERLTRGVIGYELGLVEQGFNRHLGPTHNLGIVIAAPKYPAPNKPALQRVNVADIGAVLENEAMRVSKFGPLLAVDDSFGRRRLALAAARLLYP